MARNTSSVRSAPDFDRFLSRTIILGELVAESQVHIGSGEETPSIDSPLIRVNLNGVDVPYLPGSSIKGVLRSFLESILRDSDEDRAVVKYIFGSSDKEERVRGHASFSDCLPVEPITTHTKPGVAIDPATGAARYGMRYSIETIAPGSRFHFKLILENIDLLEDSRISSAIKMLLREMNEGNIAIGGKTSAGLGLVRLAIHSIRFLSEEQVRNLDFQYRDITNEIEL